MATWDGMKPCGCPRSNRRHRDRAGDRPAPTGGPWSSTRHHAGGSLRALQAVIDGGVCDALDELVDPHDRLVGARQHIETLGGRHVQVVPPFTRGEGWGPLLLLSIDEQPLTGRSDRAEVEFLTRPGTDRAGAEDASTPNVPAAEEYDESDPF